MKIKNIRKINNENLYDINTENKVFLCKEIINDVQNNTKNNTQKDNTTKNDILLNNIDNENICIIYNDKKKFGIIYDKRKLNTYSKNIG